MPTQAEPVPSQLPNITSPTMIRLAKPTEEDAQAIAQLGRSVYHATFHHTCSAEDMTQYLDSTYTPSIITSLLQQPQTYFFLATRDGNVLGFVQMMLGTTEPCLSDYDGLIELQKIYIGVEHHGGGVAAALMQHSLNDSKERGFKNVWLGVYEHNHRALKFYNKFGFVKVGTHDFYVGTDRQTDHVCVRHLE
ncbi:hypothetical protein PROFUN_08821 [Planoprotostelium fungivorum]|uniref:N-acetyltransferase domain-containing protein n=1 Tax=Planoprotostelium fungivorum TaxID=1890364 RepID=A0A2P6MVU7_9EUKA|nr:hypothetical protein PROFUN_08821 [Planoprotostelium fungivorum]